MALTRLPYCSPYRLFRAMVGTPRSAAERLHRAYATFAWRSMGGRHFGLVALLVTLWPLIFMVMATMFTRRIGPKVAAATGKSVARQLCEQIWLALAHSIPPDKYYVFELFRDERRALAADYVLRYELKGGFHNLMHLWARSDPAMGNTKHLLTEKLDFFRRCQAGGVDTARVLFQVEHDPQRDAWRLVPEGQGDCALPGCDLFIKPARGKGGRGCEKWFFAGSDYRDPRGRTLSRQALLRHIEALARRRGRYLIQECLVNHAALRDLSPGITSLRITSCRTENGNFEVTNATLKIAFAGDSAVDNFHRGGGVAAVDVGTGMLGQASDSWQAHPCVWHDAHPATGARIAGRILPLWPETRDLVVRAHRLFPDRIMLGFDVAVTDRGPVIIEGNVQSGCDMIQRTSDLPVGRQRLGELLAFHATHAINRPLPPKQMIWFGPQDYFGRR